MKKKNWIVIALCIAIVGMGIGFAALAQNLQINATANITGEWNIAIDHINYWPREGVTVVGTPSFDGTSATFEFDLAYPGAYAEFNVRIRNNGNIDAILNSITGLTAINNAEPSEIRFNLNLTGPTIMGATNHVEVDTTGGSFTLPDGGTIVLPAGAFVFVEVRAEWVIQDGVESTIPDVKSKTATINFNYVQNT